MERLLFYIGVVGNVISVLVFASPIKTFWRIVKNKSTEDFEPAPYVLTLLSSSMWVYYGISKPDGLLVATVNGVGIALEAIYVSLFLVFASPSQRVKTAALAAVLDVGFFGGVILVTRLALHGDELRLTVIGAICVCLSMFMYGSPLAAMIAKRDLWYLNSGCSSHISGNPEIFTSLTPSLEIKSLLETMPKGKCLE